LKFSFSFTVAMVFFFSIHLKYISSDGVADLLAAFFLSVDIIALCASLFETDLFGVFYLPLKVGEAAMVEVFDVGLKHTDSFTIEAN
jgi:hypothetical protein